ncbi:putative splicing arginine serine-rich 6 [Brachionus plicatilis]|uniref:Putative splicing arginine serine-rich 6 n=1 Tax=Brachionus plicatilis TaxID=10195 RepID=A0A3M7RPM3_BRAPC|nr:putative splicing arginine serine-rich 6 [Brachionus plicatilis]
MPRAELFVGNLSKDITRQDIEDVFDKYGRLIKCEVKNKDTGASFCFIEFEEERDAEEALRVENGKDMLGNSMVIQWAKGKERRGGGFGRSERGRGGFGDRGRGGFRDSRGGGAPHCRGGGSGGSGGGGGDRYGGSFRRGGDRRENGRRDYERRRSRSRSRSR